jgi:hypothetical protein
MPKYLKVNSLGNFQLRGKQQEVELHSLSLSLKKLEKPVQQKHKRMFWRRAEKQ